MSYSVMLVLFLAANAQTRTQTGSQIKKIESTAARHFDKGKELIENNCIDCMDGTQSGMEQGIQEIEAALQAGYRSRKAAYELLSDAYAHMSTYTAKNPEEEKIYTTKLKQINRRLFELYPEDPEVLQRYETTLENDAERLEVLKRLVNIKPTPASEFSLGILLMQQRNVTGGLPLVRSAITTEDNAEAVMSYVGSLIEKLDGLGCPLADAPSWNQKAYEAFDKATRGAGDASALPQFKQNFSTALDRISCSLR